MVQRSRTSAFPSPLRASAARDVPATLDDVDRALRLAFAPTHKLAFGVAIGTAAGLTLCAVTLAALLVDGERRVPVELLAQFLAGYERTWLGVLIGALWGGAVGFVAGWFTAFVRNLALAVWLLVVRTRADFAASREFLDHI